jgi:hypothetical protein
MIVIELWRESRVSELEMAMVGDVEVGVRQVPSRMSGI